MDIHSVLQSLNTRRRRVPSIHRDDTVRTREIPPFHGVIQHLSRDICIVMDFQTMKEWWVYDRDRIPREIHRTDLYHRFKDYYPEVTINEHQFWALFRGYVSKCEIKRTKLVVCLPSCEERVPVVSFTPFNCEFMEKGIGRRMVTEGKIRVYHECTSCGHREYFNQDEWPHPDTNVVLMGPDVHVDVFYRTEDYDFTVIQVSFRSKTKNTDWNRIVHSVGRENSYEVFVPPDILDRDSEVIDLVDEHGYICESCSDSVQERTEETEDEDQTSSQVA